MGWTRKLLIKHWGSRHGSGSYGVRMASHCLHSYGSLPQAIAGDLSPLSFFKKKKKEKKNRAPSMSNSRRYPYVYVGLILFLHE